jgi:putative ABC transport system permease protein
VAVDAGTYIRLAVGLVLLFLVTAGALRAGRVELGWAPLRALLRGGIQLALVGLALRGVLSAPPTVAVALGLMMATATRTATTRLRGLDRPGKAVVVACVTGAGVALLVIFLVGMLPFQARYVVALGGIVIGNTMTGATLAGRHLLSGLRSRREEVEGWLALGATPRQAVSRIARDAAGEAMVPVLDQTRTTGLVTLPGAFIGALLGGANPEDAARFQIVVLAAIICAEAIVAVIMVTLLGAPARIPAEPESQPAH